MGFSDTSFSNILFKLEWWYTCDIGVSGLGLNDVLHLSEIGHNNIDLGPNNKGLVTHALMLI
jgi:hypothetical protein